MSNVENIVPRGRPRAFNRDVALERAMDVFWAAGYEGASIPSLTQAMGISPQSLYAAFNSKEALYREAIARYQDTLGAFGVRAMDEEVDVIDAMARLLRDAAVTFSLNPATPGCMITTAPSGVSADSLTQFGQQLRATALQKVEQRLQRGVAEGQIREGTDCAAWARYITAIVQGMSVQARDAASSETLLSVAEVAASTLQLLRPPQGATVS